MAKIQCLRCGYFDGSTGGKRCSRYDISVAEENVCVDCDETEDFAETDDTLLE